MNEDAVSNSPSNPSELRRSLLDLIASSPLTVDEVTIDNTLVEEAVEEIISGMIKEYLKEGGLTACEKIVGQILLSKLEG